MVEEKREKLKVGKRFNSLFMKWAADVRLRTLELKTKLKHQEKFHCLEEQSQGKVCLT